MKHVCVWDALSSSRAVGASGTFRFSPGQASLMNPKLQVARLERVATFPLTHARRDRRDSAS